MKAVILVGGYGTRLRPLTNELPKPLLPFLGRPMVEWQIEALKKAGVEDIILAIGYKEEVMRNFVKRMRCKYNVRIECSVESEPLGTAGPLKLAQDLICSSREDIGSFLMLSSDIICDYPIHQLICFHNSRNSMASVLVARHEETHRFGVLRFEAESGLVSSFVEKPPDFQGNWVNAGVYVLSKKVIESIQLRSTSLEREVFPQLVEQKQMYAMTHEGLWRDIGQARDFIECTQLLMENLHARGKHSIDEFHLVGPGPGRVGLNLIHPSASIGKGTVGPFCVIHARASLGAGAVIVRSVLMDDVKVGENCLVEEAIVQDRTRIGANSKVEHVCMIGTASVVPADSLLRCASFTSTSSV